MNAAPKLNVFADLVFREQLRRLPVWAASLKLTGGLVKEAAASIDGGGADHDVGARDEAAAAAKDIWQLPKHEVHVRGVKGIRHDHIVEALHGIARLHKEVQISLPLLAPVVLALMIRWVLHGWPVCLGPIAIKVPVFISKGWLQVTAVVMGYLSRHDHVVEALHGIYAEAFQRFGAL
jgi:hypothetical protein